MKLYIVVEEKSGEIIWTDGKTYETKDKAFYAKSTYNKFYKKNANLKIVTLNMSKPKSKPNNPNKVA